MSRRGTFSPKKGNNNPNDPQFWRAEAEMGVGVGVEGGRASKFFGWGGVAHHWLLR